jgi:hypothetical protein
MHQLLFALMIKTKTVIIWFIRFCFVIFYIDSIVFALSWTCTQAIWIARNLRQRFNI